MNLFSLFRHKKTPQDEEVERAKRRMHKAADVSLQTTEKVKHRIEENGITVYLVRAMGGKHGS